MKTTGKAPRKSSGTTVDSTALDPTVLHAARVPGDELQSWKEIGAFIGRDERTAMRWAKDQGMPVSRIPGGARGRVYGSRLRYRRGWPGAAIGRDATSNQNQSRK